MFINCYGGDLYGVWVGLLWGLLYPDDSTVIANCGEEMIRKLNPGKQLGKERTEG